MTTQQVTKGNEAVQGLISDLTSSPERAGQLALQFVLEQVQKGDLPQEVLKEIRDALPNTGEEADTDMAPEREAFVAKYGIRVLADSQVAVTLPAGSTRIEFLREAQELAPKLYGQNAILPDRLQNWSGARVFTDAIEGALSLAIDGNVKDSTGQTRSEQEEEGWNNVDIQDLAVAHAAYFIATGKNLFAGNIVRARGGALYFYSYGLDVTLNYLDHCSYIVVAASRALPSPNPATP